MGVGVKVDVAVEEAQLQHLGVFGEEHLEFVEIGQLVAGGIDDVVVGIAFQNHAVARLKQYRHPGIQDGPIRVYPPVLLLGKLFIVGSVRVFRMELFKIVARIGPEIAGDSAIDECGQLSLSIRGEEAANLKRIE